MQVNLSLASCVLMGLAVFSSDICLRTQALGTVYTPGIRASLLTWYPSILTNRPFQGEGGECV